MKNKKGMIIIFSAPSGAGKTSICDQIVKDKNIVYSISTTTREPRKGEKNGREYFFVNEKCFKQMIKKGLFVEWAVVHGNYYGTSKKTLEKIINSGKDVLLDIDVQGALKIKKQYKDALMIFVMTPSLKVLKERLLKRNKDSLDVIKTRIHNARKEISCLPKYNYLIINNKLDESIKQAKAIILAERISIKRNKVNIGGK